MKLSFSILNGVFKFNVSTMSRLQLIDSYHSHIQVSALFWHYVSYRLSGGKASERFYVL